MVRLSKNTQFNGQPQLIDTENALKCNLFGFFGGFGQIRGKGRYFDKNYYARRPCRTRIIA